MTDKQPLTLSELLLETVNSQKKRNGLKEAQGIYWQLTKLTDSLDRVAFLMNSIKEKKLENSLVYATVFLFNIRGTICIMP
jgi:hypothetical protein